MGALEDANKDSQQLKSEISRLSSNLASLNSVYGGVLSAYRAQ
jgi:hypothetical protein